GRGGARCALPPGAGAGDRESARTRESADGAVLRAGIQLQGNRRRAGRDRIARVPVAQPGGRPTEGEVEGVVRAVRVSETGLSRTGLQSNREHRRDGGY